MNGLTPIEHNNQRILTTRQIADGYNTDPRVISNNYNRNKERYQEGSHYYALSGEGKREFLDRHHIEDGSQNAAVLYLWTERGALLHAKSLNTDKAWEVYGDLVENYFNPSRSLPTSGLSPQLQFMAEAVNVLATQERKIKQLEEAQRETAAAIINIKDIFTERDDDWRAWLNKMFNKAVQNSPGKDYQSLRRETYEELERRADCDLARRLSNLKRRLYEGGATNTKINSMTRIDVIEADTRLKEIYTSIIKELALRYSA